MVNAPRRTGSDRPGTLIRIEILKLLRCGEAADTLPVPGQEGLGRRGVEQGHAVGDAVAARDAGETLDRPVDAAMGDDEDRAGTTAAPR